MDRDANGTLLRYVVQEGVLLNTELLEQGALALDPAFSESACLSSFQAAQQTAQLANRGQWGAPPTPIAVLVQPQPVILVPVVDSGGGTGGSGLEAVCSCAGNSLNCSDFSTHRAAQACHDYCQSQGTGDIHGLDGNDNDGLACESLP
jgi:micrococcal nuclease